MPTNEKHVMNSNEILNMIATADSDMVEVLDLHCEGSRIYLESAKPAVIENGDPDECYDILTVSKFVGSYGLSDDADIGQIEAERIIKICAEDSDEIICAFIVTPYHEAIYVYKNLEYPPEFCDEAANLLLEFESEVVIG